MAEPYIHRFPEDTDTEGLLSCMYSEKVYLLEIGGRKLYIHVGREMDQITACDSLIDITKTRCYIPRWVCNEAGLRGRRPDNEEAIRRITLYLRQATCVMVISQENVTSCWLHSNLRRKILRGHIPNALNFNIPLTWSLARAFYLTTSFLPNLEEHSLVVPTTHELELMWEYSKRGIAMRNVGNEAVDRPLSHFHQMLLEREETEDTIQQDSLETILGRRPEIRELLDGFRKTGLETPLGTLTMNRILQFYQMALQLEAAKSELREAYQSFREQRPQNIPLDMRSLEAELESVWGLWEHLGVGGVDRFLRARHNIFGNLYCVHHGIEWDGEDINLLETFEYQGEYSYLTPDAVHFNREAMEFTIFEFAATNMNPHQVLQDKLDKYEPLREDLEAHLQRNGMRIGGQIRNPTIRLVVVVLGLRGNRYMIISNAAVHDFREAMREDQNLMELIQLSDRVCNTRVYRQYCEMQQRDEVKFISEKETAMNRFATQAMDAIHRILQFPNWDLPNMDMYKDHDPTVLQKAKFNEIRYIQHCREKINNCIRYEELENQMIQYIRGDKQPQSIKDFMETDMAEVVRFAAKEREKETRKAIECRNKNYRTLAKTFKLPFMPSDLSMRLLAHTTEFCCPYEWENRLDDGTFILAKQDWYEEVEDEQWKEEELKDGQREGLHINYREDLDYLTDILMFFDMEGNPVGREDRMDRDELYNLPVFRRLFQTQLWEILCYWDELARDICYMEGRRSHGDSKKLNSRTVFKQFKKYGLAIRRGVQITKEKQIRYRVSYPVDYDHPDFQVDNQHFHSFKNRLDGEEICTKWLTMSLADLQHFLKLKAFAISLASEIIDKIAESSRVTRDAVVFPWDFYYRMMAVAMEHKRGTSTTLQMNRYIYHSFTALLSNRKELIKDIIKDPVRSRLEASMRARQLQWVERLAVGWEGIIRDRVEKMGSTDSAYDRVLTFSMMGDQQIEFSLSMMEIYAGNMFNKESGFQSHRVKGAMQKMVKSESDFQNNKNKLDELFRMRPLDFSQMNDTPFSFCEDYVSCAAKQYFRRDTVQLSLKKAMLKTICITVRAGMKLTSSLWSGPYVSNSLNYSSEVKTDKAFINLFRLVDEMKTPCLVSMIQKMDSLEAIFSAFPKAQIGKPREISIQAAKLRIFVLFMETFMGLVAKDNPKDMLGNDDVKEKTQARTMSDLKQRLIALRRGGSDCSIMSLNMDSSGWSPNFVMEHFVLFVMAMGLPQELERLFCSLIISFSNKIVMTPVLLLKKWANKPKAQLEKDEFIQQFRVWSEENGGYIFMQSSMGQGMFHKLSNLYHCVMDDMCTKLCSRILKRLHEVNINETTLITSDDKTKMLLFQYPTKRLFIHSLKTYMLLIDACSRMANIHINMKKSALHYMICEFNSLFSIGKRMEMATIKDIYTVCSIPDYTSPEDAVAHLVGALRRCLEHGCYIPTIRVIADQLRKMTMKAYRFDQMVIRDLCSLFGCTEDLLPPQLGFFPKNYLIETLLFGHDIHCYNPNNTEQLNRFYRGLYTAHANWEDHQIDEAVLNAETMMGKFQLELPTRLDKRVLSMKKEFYTDRLRLPMETVLDNYNKMSLMSFATMGPVEQFEQHAMFGLMGVKRKYEFQETMTVHSLIRALSITTRKGEIHPRSRELNEIKEQISDLMKNKNRSMDEEVELDSLMRRKQNYQFDIVGFARAMVNRHRYHSAIGLLVGYEEVMNCCIRVHQKVERLVVNNRHAHKTYRALRFNTSRIGLNARPYEIIRGLFRNGEDEPGRVLESINKLMDVAGVHNFQIARTDNQFQLIRNIMRGAQYPYKLFMEFCKFFQRSYTFNSVEMLSEFPCRGNLEDNLLGIYQYRTRPDCILEEQGALYPSEQDMVMHMAITLNTLPDVWDEIGNNRVTIEPLDRPITIARKLYLLTREVDGDCNHRDIRSNKVFFHNIKRRGRNHEVLLWEYKDIVASISLVGRLAICAIASRVRQLDEQAHYSALSFMQTDITRLQQKQYHITWATTQNRMNLYQNMSYNHHDHRMLVRIQKGKGGWKQEWSVAGSLSASFDWGFDDHMERGNDILVNNPLINRYQSRYLLSKATLDRRIGDMNMTLLQMLNDPPNLQICQQQLQASGLLENLGLEYGGNGEILDNVAEAYQMMNQVGQGAFRMGADILDNAEIRELAENPPARLIPEPQPPREVAVQAPNREEQEENLFYHAEEPRMRPGMEENLVEVARVLERIREDQYDEEEEHRRNEERVAVHPEDEILLHGILEEIIGKAFSREFQMLPHNIRRLHRYLSERGRLSQFYQHVFTHVREIYRQKYQREMHELLSFYATMHCSNKLALTLGCPIPTKFVRKTWMIAREGLIFMQRPREDPIVEELEEVREVPQ